MMYHAKNAVLELNGSKMDYITFGCGRRNLLIIPGLGDGLKTVKGTAIPFSILYRLFAKEFKIYVFSQKEPLEDSSITSSMAEDIFRAMEQLGIMSASVLGVSMGGMIAQHLASAHPERVEKLVLAVTATRSNILMEESIRGWLEAAALRDIKQILRDTAERSYSAEKLNTYRKLYPLFSLYPKPKSFRRFSIMANACLKHNASEQVSKITAPTLIIGAENDRIVGVQASHELNTLIPNSQCYIYEKYGHCVYEEATDFQQRVLNFLK